MTKEEFAKMLDGREIGNEISRDEAATAADNGLVVVYGYSDDNMEFEGAIFEEIPAYDGGTALIVDDEVLSEDHDCECEYCGFKEKIKKAKKIHALWCKEGDYSWTFKTDIPHATFDVMEDGEKFCRGIVFALADLK